MARGRAASRGPMPSHIEEEPESSPTIGGLMPQPPPAWPSRPSQDNPSSRNNVANDSQQQTEQLQFEDSGEQRRTRGPTYMSRGWANNGGILHIETNELGQPILDEASKLASNLGVLARTGSLLPLNHYAWTDVPDLNKEQIWHHIKVNTDATEDMKKILMQSIGKKWREWKSEVKRKYYSVYNTDSERLDHCPDRVEESHWRALIHYWGTDKAHEKSRKNKVSRAKQVTPHTTGRMSFARVKEKLTKDEGIPPTRRRVYKYAHTKKDGTIVNPEAAQIIAKMDDLLASQRPESPDPEYGQDDIFSQVMGPDKPGRVRTFGLGPTPTQVFGSSYGKSQAERREIDSRVNEQIERMRDLMEASVEARMAKLREEMEAKFQMQLHATLQAMGIPVSQRDTISSPLSNTQVPDASSSHRVTTPPFQSNPQLAQPQNIQSKRQREHMGQRELCYSSPTNPKEKSYSKKGKKGKKQVNYNASNTGKKEVHLLSSNIPKKVLAKGFIVSKDPTKVIGQTKLGLGFLEVCVIEALESTAKLVRPYGQFKTMGDVVGITIAWPIGDVAEL